MGKKPKPTDKYYEFFMLAPRKLGANLDKEQCELLLEKVGNDLTEVAVEKSAITPVRPQFGEEWQLELSIFVELPVGIMPATNRAHALAEESRESAVEIMWEMFPHLVSQAIELNLRERARATSTA